MQEKLSPSMAPIERHSLWQLKCIHNNSSATYYSAINGQGAIAKLADSVVTFNIHPLSAPLDGWGRIASDLTVQNCISTKWFNPISRVITFEDWRFWEKTQASRSKRKL